MMVRFALVHSRVLPGGFRGDSLINRNLLIIMFKTLLTILLGIILLQGDASAHEVLVVQSMAVKPYEEAVRGFVGTCKGTMKRIVLSAQQGSDLARIVREEPPRLIVVLGAEALAQVKKFKQIPVVYLMVLNPPVAAQEQQRITGVTMTIPPERYLTVLKKALPDARRIGLLYDPKKSGPLVRRALQASRAMGFEVVSREVRSAREVPALLEAMRGAIDAFWMIPDPTVLTPDSVEFLLLFAQENLVPVFSFAEKYEKMGALFSLDVDPVDMGKQAGEMANRLLGGTPVDELPRVDARRAVLRFNRSVARKLGVNPDEIERGWSSERN